MTNTVITCFFYVKMYEISEKMGRIGEGKLIGEEKLIVSNSKDF